MQWADYFDRQGVRYAFFSAANATALQEARRAALARAESEAGTEGGGAEDSSSDSGSESKDSISESETRTQTPPDGQLSDEDSDADPTYLPLDVDEDTPEAQDPRTKVLSVLELENLFLTAAPELSSKPPHTALSSSS